MSEALRTLRAIAPERRIYVDLDDVVADTTPRIVPLLNSRFVRQVDFEDLTSFDLGIAFGLDSQEHRHAMDCVHEHAFLRELPLREGALEALRSWDRRGFHIAVITGRPPETHAISRAWLSDQGVPHHTFVCVDKYHRHASCDERIPLERLASLSFALALEDSLDMALFLARHSRGRVCLMDRPWNRAQSLRDSPESNRIERIREWREVAF